MPNGTLKFPVLFPRSLHQDFVNPLWDSKSSTPRSLPGERIELRTAVIGSFSSGRRGGEEKLYSIPDRLWILARVLTISHWLNNAVFRRSNSISSRSARVSARSWNGVKAFQCSRRGSSSTVLSSLVNRIETVRKFLAETRIDRNVSFSKIYISRDDCEVCTILGGERGGEEAEASLIYHRAVSVDVKTPFHRADKRRSSPRFISATLRGTFVRNVSNIDQPSHFSSPQSPLESLEN